MQITKKDNNIENKKKKESFLLRGTRRARSVE